MADWESLAEQITAVAEKVLPLISPGAAAAVEAGKEVFDLIERFKAVSGKTTVELEAVRAKLEPAVLAHLDRTAASLD